MLRGSDIRRLATMREPDSADEIERGQPVLAVRFRVHRDGWRLHLSARPGVRLLDRRFIPVDVAVYCDSSRIRGGQRYHDVVRSVARRVCPVTRDVPITIVRTRRTGLV